MAQIVNRYNTAKKTLLTAAVVITVGLVVSACGAAIQIKPAHYGKWLHSDGWAPEIIEPSKVRMPWICWLCPELYTVDASEHAVKEEFRGTNALYMPESELKMDFDVRFITAVHRGPALNEVFAKQPADENNNIGIAQIYKTYGRNMIRNVVREVLAKYKIEQVAANRQAINAELFKRVTERSKGTPLKFLSFGLADVQLPKLITDAKELAAQRREQIQQQKAQQQIQLVKLDTQLKQVQGQHAIRIQKAKSAAEENKILADSATDRYLAYKRLEVLELMAGNSAVKWVPFGALDTVGANVAIFGNKKQ